MTKLKIGFAGTPDFAASHLSALLEAGYVPTAVFTQPDRKAGRGKKLSPSPVKVLAEKHQLSVYQPSSLKDESAQAVFESLNLDLLVVVAYGLILPTGVLDAPTFGCINVHASLLPKWRGAAPIERAILAGDSESGVTIMQMDAGLDTGDMLHKVTVPILDTHSRQDLEHNLISAGTQGLVYTLKNFDSVLKQAEKQVDADATYASKLEKSEALLDFSLDASSLNRTIRAGIGRNPAFAFLNNERVRLLSATPSSHAFSAEFGSITETTNKNFTIACNNSSLVVDSIQLPGKNPVQVSALLNSKPDFFKVGSVFTMADA
ncbi:MAG: methionyl-tRNA formyltransferase [Pseudohongiellaceae bacterium]